MCENSKKKARSITMTTGSLWRNIFLFSIPLMCSQLLEVIFNLSDVAVVGRFADYKALGAVGSTTLLVTLFVGFLIGMGSGVNVRVAHALGSGDRQVTENTIHSALLLCALMGLLVGAVCFFFSGGMLKLLNTKDDLIGQASLYLKIYAVGLPAMGVYNFGNGVLSARGDTKRPLYYLAAAGVLNVILNLFFVIVLHMAAAGVATATAIAQYASAALIMTHLLRRRDECHVSLKKVRLHKDTSIAILMIGVPAGIQNAIFAIANLFVQSGVNSFDTYMVSGNAAATNADTIIYKCHVCFLYRMFQFYEPELRCRKQKKSSEELLYQPVLFLQYRTDPWTAPLSLWSSVPVAVCHGCCRYRCRHAADQDHGVFLLCVLFYGLYDRRIPWDRKDHHPDDHYHHGLLRLPYHMDLHDLCLGPHHPGTVSSVSVFMDHHIDRRDHLLYCQLPETQRPVADFLFFIKKARSSALHDHK